MDSTLEAVKQFLKKNLDSAKFKHSKGVSRMAVELAQKHGIPVRAAKLAGLLHDIGRIYGKQQLVRYAKRHALKIPCKKEAGTTRFCLSIYYKRRYYAIATYKTGIYMHKCRFCQCSSGRRLLFMGKSGTRFRHWALFPLAFRAEARL